MECSQLCRARDDAPHSRVVSIVDKHHDHCPAVPRASLDAIELDRPEHANDGSSSALQTIASTVLDAASQMQHILPSRLSFLSTHLQLYHTLRRAGFTSLAQISRTELELLFAHLDLDTTCGPGLLIAQRLGASLPRTFPVPTPPPSLDGTLDDLLVALELVPAKGDADEAGYALGLGSLALHTLRALADIPEEDLERAAWSVTWWTPMQTIVLLSRLQLWRRTLPCPDQV